MANQRRAGKVKIGGFVDKSLHEEIAKTGIDKTQFIELSIVRELVLRKRLTHEQVQDRVRAGRIKSATLATLESEGVFPRNNHKTRSDHVATSGKPR